MLKERERMTNMSPGMGGVLRQGGRKKKEKIWRKRGSKGKVQKGKRK